MMRSFNFCAYLFINKQVAYKKMPRYICNTKHEHRSLVQFISTGCWRSSQDIVLFEEFIQS